MATKDNYLLLFKDKLNNCCKTIAELYEGELKCKFLLMQLSQMIDDILYHQNVAVQAMKNLKIVEGENKILMEKLNDKKHEVSELDSQLEALRAQMNNKQKQYEVLVKGHAMMDAEYKKKKREFAEKENQLNKVVNEQAIEIKLLRELLQHQIPQPPFQQHLLSPAAASGLRPLQQHQIPLPPIQQQLLSGPNENREDPIEGNMRRPRSQWLPVTAVGVLVENSAGNFNLLFQGLVYNIRSPGAVAYRCYNRSCTGALKIDGVARKAGDIGICAYVPHSVHKCQGAANR